MDLIEKINKKIDERADDSLDTINDWSKQNSKDYDKLRQSYWAISDNIQNFVEGLNSLNGDTGAFTMDLRTAKQLLNIFKKLTIGKYL